MSEYPNSDEEFELMYGDELEVLNEHEDSDVQPRPVQASNIATHKENNLAPVSSDKVSPETNLISLSQPKPTSLACSGLIRDIQHFTDKESGKKRSIQELFGEIDDILCEEVTENRVKRRKNDNINDDFAVIDHIIALRKLAKERQNPVSLLRRDLAADKADHFVRNVSYCVPKYSFIALTNHSGKRVYVRCHSEQYELEEIKKVAKTENFTGMMGETFKDIWEEARQLLNKRLDNDESTTEAIPPPSANMSVLKESLENNTDLWVDLYKPHNYFELLSDESTNRTLLKWLKLWDKVVFNRRPKPKIAKTETTDKFNNYQKMAFNTTLDEHGRPEQKIALLCGPPGLGKTTLAQMVAKQAGYNVIEVNASDDRSVANFKTILENATQMRSVLDRENRPNCVVFDEIDGAPSSSIEYLIKFVMGTGKPKKKKDTRETTNILKRPIICICNDVYVPALRPLRQIAFVVNFPPTASARLAERLGEIARHQKVNADLGALHALCEKCTNDIRSCLSVLHFFKSLSKAITLSQVLKANVGQKDVQKGLFAVWQDVFQIKHPKNSAANSNAKSDLKQRMQKILHVVNSFGDHERLAQGIFENYPSMVLKNSGLETTCEALEWFCYFDVINKDITSNQNYTLTSYLSYAFVIWHFCFARPTWQKLTYPSLGYEVRMKSQKNVALLTEIMKGMQPKIRAFTYSSSLKLDTLPILSRIITPPFRPINLHLYTDKEKHDLDYVVSVMIDYNLNYVQERTFEGSYVFKLDPNIEEVVTFPGFSPTRFLSYSNKQLIAREIEVEKMQRAEIHKAAVFGVVPETTSNKPKEKETPRLPNHMQRLKPKALKPQTETIVTKDFFGRLVTKAPIATNRLGPELNHDIWYLFKEGYSNAVRKKITISTLM